MIVLDVTEAQCSLHVLQHKQQIEMVFITKHTTISEEITCTRFTLYKGVFKNVSSIGHSWFSSINTFSAFQFTHSYAGTEFLILRTLAFSSSSSSSSSRSNNTGQQISKKIFVSVMNMLLIYSFASMKLEKGHKKLLGSSFKIMLPL